MAGHKIAPWQKAPPALPSPAYQVAAGGVVPHGESIRCGQWHWSRWLQRVKQWWGILPDKYIGSACFIIVTPPIHVYGIKRQIPVMQLRGQRPFLMWLHSAGLDTSGVVGHSWHCSVYSWLCPDQMGIVSQLIHNNYMSNKNIPPP